MTRGVFEKIAGAALCVVTLVAAPWASGQEVDFEEVGILSAQDVVPVGWLEGEHYRVAEEVVNDCLMNSYRIESDYGAWEVWGEILLRNRIREVNALERLSEVSRTKVAASSAARSVSDGVRDAAAVVQHPVKTARGIPHGIKNRYKVIKRAFKPSSGSEKRSAGDEAKSWGRSYLGYDEAERRWAHKLAVDPYSSNEVLHEAIRRIAKVDALAGTGAGLVTPVPKIPGAEYLETVYSVVWTKGPAEVLEFNRDRLARMGFEEELIDALVQVEWLTPTILTSLVALVEEMEEVEARPVALSQALTVRSDADAFFFVESLVLATWYHQNREPLARFIGGTGIPVALTRGGRLVVFSALDDLCWSEDVARDSIVFAEYYNAKATEREFVISGSVSDRYRTEAAQIGWKVTSGLREQLLPRLPWGVE